MSAIYQGNTSHRRSQTNRCDPPRADIKTDKFVERQFKGQVHLFAASMIGVQRAISLFTSAASGC
jgi:hypothetical protein